MAATLINLPINGELSINTFPAIIDYDPNVLTLDANEAETPDYPVALLNYGPNTQAKQNFNPVYLWKKKATSGGTGTASPCGCTGTKTPLRCDTCHWITWGLAVIIIISLFVRTRKSKS